MLRATGKAEEAAHRKGGIFRSYAERLVSHACAIAASLSMLGGCGGPDDSSFYYGPGGSGDQKRDASPYRDDGGVIECVPLTCEEIGASCGRAPDGCLDVIECGECAEGETCGGDGPNRCGTERCDPSTCAQAGAACGLASDGCGDVIGCGSCPAPLTCGGEGVANTCGCMPATCDDLGLSCGAAPDRCGGMIECGECGEGETCGGAGANRCGPKDCVPRSCEEVGVECGLISDGCSGVLDCGGCIEPGTCGGGGIPNKCDCTPRTCAQLGAECGEVEGGCGETIDCGECGTGQICGGEGEPNKCSGEGPKCPAGWADCNGVEGDGCEAYLADDPANCGACGEACDDGNPCTDGDECKGGSCAPGIPIACDSPPDLGCYEVPGTCEPATGVCAYSPAEEGTPCGDPCHVCKSGQCKARPQGESFDGVASHRCCADKPTDISVNEAHCGGCNLSCATGEVCESVAKTTGCSSHPSSTSGRCTCAATIDCPIGNNGEHQTCRNVTPYAWVCAPVSSSVCAKGQVFVDLEACPNYCEYP